MINWLSDLLCVYKVLNTVLMTILWQFKSKDAYFKKMSVFIIYMHYVILSTCGCTSFMFFFISKVIHRWTFFWKAKLGLEDRQSKLKFVLIWLEGINVFYFPYWSIAIDLVVLYFCYLWGVSQSNLVSKILLNET